MEHINAQRKIGIFLVCFLVIFMLFPMTASADVGPKRGIYITFENMGDEVCYGSLLAQHSSYMVDLSDYDGKYLRDYSKLDLDIWRAFLDYQDADGYVLYQIPRLCSGTKKHLSSDYGSPDSFKIILYYPETDTFLVSEIYECYAFDSYYLVDMKGIDVSCAESQGTVLVAKNNYNYIGESLSLICRIVLTILLEVGVAYLFGFRQKRLLKFIAGVNVVTQVILNVMLNVIRYQYGFLAYMVFYLPHEIVVYIIEIILYVIFFNIISETKIPAWKSVVYALTANTITYIGGFMFSLIVPEIF